MYSLNLKGEIKLQNIVIYKNNNYYLIIHDKKIELQSFVHKFNLNYDEIFTWARLQVEANKLPSIHPTEIKFPEQTKRFRELLEEEYQTHLIKNADYSAWNVNGTGLIGLVVKMWDKMSRIMSLSGFDIGTGTFTGTKRNMVEDESIVDTAKDMGVYAKIFRIYSEGKWGK